MKPDLLQITQATEDKEFDFVYDIRAKVFQEEYGIDEEEDVDGNDHIAYHYLAVLNGIAVATARWRITLGGRVAIERVAVLPKYRRMGIGTELVRHLLKSVPKNRELFVESHESVVPFWRTVEFEEKGDVYEWEPDGRRYQSMSFGSS